MKYSVNEIKISYREKLGTLKSEPIKSSQHAAKLLYENWDKGTIGVQETFKILLLNNSNKVKGIYPLSTGGITGTLVDVRILFAIVLKTLSVGILLAHNHPNHKLVPSEADKKITNKIREAAKLFDIKVLDHLIITPEGDYYSFADHGLL